jgi:hypothetical protein
MAAVCALALAVAALISACAVLEAEARYLPGRRYHVHDRRVARFAVSRAAKRCRKKAPSTSPPALTTPAPLPSGPQLASPPDGLSPATVGTNEAAALGVDGGTEGARPKSATSGLAGLPTESPLHDGKGAPSEQAPVSIQSAGGPEPAGMAAAAAAAAAPNAAAPDAPATGGAPKTALEVLADAEISEAVESGILRISLQGPVARAHERPVCSVAANIDFDQLETLTSEIALDTTAVGQPPEVSEWEKLVALYEGCGSMEVAEAGDGCVWEVKGLLEALYEQGTVLMRLGAEPRIAYSLFV